MKFDLLPLYQLEKSLFSRSIIDEAQELFEDEYILEILHNERDRTLTFTVEGFDAEFHTVTIKYLDSASYKSFRCNCPSTHYCEHLAAVFQLMIYVAKNNMHIEDYLLDEEMDVLNEPIILQPSEVKKFRIIPATSDFDYDYILSEIRPARIPQDFLYIRQFLHTLEKSNLLITKFTVRHWDVEDKDTHHVEFRFVNSFIEVKCNSCSNKSDFLCAHAYTALSDAMYNESFKHLWDNTHDYDKIIQLYSEQSGISPTILKSYYSVNLEGGFYFQKNNDSFKDPNDLRLLSEFISNAFSSNTLSEEDFIGSKNLVDTHSNALWWSTKDEILPFLLLGKLNKARNKIISGVERTHEVFYFTQEQKKFYQKLTSDFYSSNDLPFEILTDKILTILKENFETLNSIFNYVGHPSKVMINYSEKIKKSALSPITFVQDEVSAVFELQDELEELYKLSCIIQIGDKILDNEKVKLLTPLFLLTVDNKAYLFKDREQSVILRQFQESRYFAFDRKAIGQLLPMLNKLKTKCGLRTNTSTAISEKILYGGKKELYFSELGQFIIIKPYINFEDTYKQNALTEQIDDQVEEVLFDIKGDEATNFIQQLSEFHDVFTKGEQVTDFFAISLHDFLSDNWFFDFFEKCKRFDIAVYGTDILQNFKFNKNKPTISAVISSGIDWFGSKVKISFDKLNVPLNSWVDMVKNNQKYIKLSDGTLGLMPEEWVEKLKALYNAGYQEDGQIKVSKYNFSIIDEYFEELSDEKAFEEIKKKKKAFENYTSIKSYKLPRSIKAELREYQMQGYRWLRFLNEYELGGCLADDMGLGKTLQILCLLAYKKERKSCFALVVVPNSLIFNWSNEIEKFCPSLKYLIHHGPNRKVEKLDQKKYDVIITTYGTATSDIEDLKEIIFDSIVLDESQAIKNPNSKRYKSVKLLKAKHRYAMTGTPIENNTFDLFAQMNFVNPGLLGNANSFRTKFAVPIDSHRDQDQGELLRKVIHPFLLRRTKEQVAKDLPEKSESIILCEMGARQKKYYDSVKNDIRNSLNKSLEKEGLGKAKFQMLEGLLRLRQICNSPQLIDKDARGDSVKIETLVDHIMTNNTNKALVFSQFVGMLGLIKERLEEMQVPYAYLDGSTKNREQEVEKFQSDRKCQVFLISIKAGNTGLNLTAAEYVYIVDPWWNPAVEAQAIDRTHRIGQVNHVFAYRMVCKDTIEEKILHLQEKKKAVASDIIQTDESVLKSLDRDDLLGLFE